MIDRAGDVRTFASPRTIGRSPASFRGSLDQLVEDFILPNLPSPDSVGEFHRLLVGYCRRADPLFLIRYMGGTERGQIYSTRRGDRFKATDNAPAWWVHYVLFHKIELRLRHFPSLVATMPTHFFEVAAQIPENISSAGWHVAHIADVKDRNVDFLSWTRDDLIARFVRNVHPCNNVPIPKPDWQKWGADKRVMSFLASVYADRYSEVWSEFVELARIPVTPLSGDGSIQYSYSSDSGKGQAVARASSRPEASPVKSSHPNATTVEYRASRLLFKADVIDALGDQDRFRVITPDGSYEMSKSDFLRAFPRIPQTKSYRDSRVYHYRRVPEAAAEFRVTYDDDRN